MIFARPRPKAIRKDPANDRKPTASDFTTANSGLSDEDIKRGEVMCRKTQVDTECISGDQTLLLLRLLGRNPSAEVVQSKRLKMVIPENQPCKYGHFCHIWKATIDAAKGELAILERAFPFFDQDGSGFITRQEMISQFAELGNLLTEEEIEQFHDILDHDHNGVVDYSEFITALQSDAIASEGGVNIEDLSSSHASAVPHVESKVFNSLPQSHQNQPSSLHGSSVPSDTMALQRHAN